VSADSTDELNVFLGVAIVAICTFRVCGGVVRSIILKHGPTTNEPLKELLDHEISEQDLQGLDIPIYATLARFRPDLGLCPGTWHGWIPEYIRIDGLSRDELLEIVLQSAALPGIYPVRIVRGKEAIDGGWCDNVPLAPLLCDDVLPIDLVFVIFLNESDRLQPPLVSYFPIRTPKSRITRDSDEGRLNLGNDAFINWGAHLTLKATPTVRSPININVVFDIEPEDEQLFIQLPDEDEPRIKNKPKIVDVVPSRPLGSFLTGTLGFSARRANRLIQLGESDMDAVIAQLLLSNSVTNESKPRCTT
jgi:predicted acylesterase/phospholipase RssA